MSRPLIGLTLDAEPAGGWSAHPWYAQRRNYADAVAAAGGLPVALPHRADIAAETVARLDGLIVTGGAFDVDPGLFGAPDRHASVTLKSDRTTAELALLRAALAFGTPVLGICGGMQLLAVALGGTLHQHIPDALPGALPHEQEGPRDRPGHDVAITPGSRLATIVGTPRLAVNSAHHQAVATAGSRLTVNATAPDGVVEGVEDSAETFVIGVQWHPEYLISPGDRAIFHALVAACR